MPNKKDQWEIDFDNLPKTKLTTKEFIKKLLASKDQEIKDAYKKGLEEKIMGIDVVVARGLSSKTLTEAEEIRKQAKEEVIEKVNHILCNERGNNKQLDDAFPIVEKILQTLK